MLSTVAKSCFKTMEITSKKDKRQKVPTKSYTVPNLATRRLRALLILEEALETIRALGFNPVQKVVLVDGLLPKLEMEYDLVPTGKPDLEKIIDGCCDTIYVATGCMCACGVPDMPHLEEVCRANDSKFPGGVVITNDEGKYLKPEGWEPPNHKELIQAAKEFGREIRGTRVKR